MDHSILNGLNEMGITARYNLVIASDLQDLARRASEAMAAYIDLALDQKDRAQIALAGGSTPANAYSLVGEEHLPWDRVDVFLGDERWVDLNDEASNAYMLQKTLFASSSGAKAVFYPIQTVEMETPTLSAEAFAKVLTKTCIGEPPVFDLMVLGLGEDGHTASLFPGTRALQNQDSWVTVGTGKGLDRITLTAQVLSAARKVIFLVSGSSKQDALKRLLDPDESSSRTPARLVQPDSEILVIADQAASNGI